MYDLAKMFLYCFNHWKLETPSVHARSSPTNDLKTYKENYTRYNFRVSFRGEGGRGGHLPPPLGSRVPPLDFDFILQHSLVVDAAPP